MPRAKVENLFDIFNVRMAPNLGIGFFTGDLRHEDGRMERVIFDGHDWVHQDVQPPAPPPAWPLDGAKINQIIVDDLQLDIRVKPARRINAARGDLADDWWWNQVNPPMVMADVPAADIQLAPVDDPILRLKPEDEPVVELSLIERLKIIKDNLEQAPEELTEVIEWLEKHSDDNDPYGRGWKDGYDIGFMDGVEDIARAN